MAQSAGHAECGKGPTNCDWPRRVSLLGGEAELVGCVKELEGCTLECNLGIQSHAQSVINDAVNEASMRAATPSWYILLSS